MGEISNGGLEGIDMEAIVRDTIREIGYSDHALDLMQIR